ncbi:MAG: CehA/McbA family metallohydrolase [Deltaproteobacteria bacterium]|nr:CehA/McbA family metallohydrolase [Deltaproteobacteria bacterium]
MPLHLLWLAAGFVLAASAARAQDPCPGLIIQGTVPDGPETHFFLPFEVPADIAEIEVRHDDLSSENILDWGLDDPNGFRGWGGGNSEPAVVGIEAASRSYVPGLMPAGTWEVVVGKAQIVETPAEYDVCVILRTEPTLPPQPRMPYEDPGVLDSEARWYAGDFHVHSRQSGDASPSISNTLEFAEEAGLDFVMLSEHNTNSGLTLYGSVQPDFPKLLIVPGVEWTTYAGHANAIGAIDWVDHKVGVRGVTVEGAIEAYQAQSALFSINHPTVPGGNFCIGCPWEIEVDPRTIDGLEAQGGIWDAIAYWEQMCVEGSHATAVGGSDDHQAGDGSGVLYSPIGMPTTMVFAENLSVDAILEGVRAGRTVIKVKSIDDPMLETELSGERVGNTVFADTATLSVRVTGGTGNTLQVIKNGVVLETESIDTDPFTHELIVDAPAEREDRYRHQVVAAVDPVTIGSYIWLRAAEPPEPGTSRSGCSCRVVTASDQDTGVLLVLLGLGARYWRRRRAR